MPFKPTLSYEEKPRFCNPINAMAGLYMNVLASKRVDSEQELLSFVRADVEQAGYNPDGRAMVGMACEYGVVSRTYAVWFYERKS
jgi:hypothetical protein